LVPPVLEALGGMDVGIVLSTVARVTPKNIPRNVRVVEMIPGDLAARSSTRSPRTAVRRKGRSGVWLECDLGQ
jgi:hypothetical protein